MSFEWCFKIAGVVAIGGWLTLAEVPAQHLTTAPQPEPPAALLLPNVDQLTLLDKAYLDAFSILKENNKCSAFYGGPSAIEALNQLKEQLEPRHLDSTVVVSMTGETMRVISVRYPLLSYRLFDRAELNLEGPFYRISASHPHRTIGRFRPNTREARVTILLHELGHLIERLRKQWLLPDDGVDEDLSDENTARVIDVCGGQIRRLRRITFAEELQAARLTLVSR